MILNIDKMKSDSRLKFSESVFDAYVENTCAYFKNISENISKISPDDSIDIISVLCEFKEYFISESEWEQITKHMLNMLQKGIKRSLFDKISNFSGLAHIAFVIYGLSLKAPKIEPFLQGINELLLSNLAEFIKNSDKKSFNTEGNYEVIKGLSGPLRYLLNFEDDEKMSMMAVRLVDVLIKRSHDIRIQGHRLPGWHYYPSEIEKSFSPVGAVNGCVNYGVSHGIGSPLAVLSVAYKSDIRKTEIKNAIDGLFSEYMNALYYVDDIPYWPGKISFEQYIGQDEIIYAPNQMSWCYGSVGILRALYMSSVAISDDKVKMFAINELIKISQMDLSNYLLTMPIICHGLVGTAAILNLMYLETGKTEFLQKITEMIESSAVISAEQFFEIEKQNARKLGVSPHLNQHNYLDARKSILKNTEKVINSRHGKTIQAGRVF